MVYLFALSAIAVATSFGFLFLRLLDREKKLGILEGLGLLGLGIIAIIMTILSLAGISFNIFNILMPFVLIIALGGIFNRIFQNPEKAYLKAKLEDKKINKLELFFLCAILFEIALVFFISLIKPMESWDAVAHWGLKAKIIYFLKGLPLNLFSMPCTEDVVFTGDYPWLWPFLQNYVHNFIGRFDDFATKMIGPFFFVSCLVIFYSILRNIKLTRLHALIFTFFLASIPHFNAYAGNGYADFILGFYYSVGFLYLYLWFGSRDRIHLLVSVIFTAMACYVKCEGLLLAVVTAFTFLSFVLFGESENRSKIFKTFIFYIITLALLSLPMFLLKKVTCANIANHTISINTFSNFKLENFWRIPSIIYAYQKQFFGIKSWNLVWILFIISVFMACRRRVLFNKEVKFLAIAIGFIFLAYTSVYMVSPLVGEDIRTVSRLLLHFLPLVIFFIACIFRHEMEMKK
jgi:hypothetical protein